MPLIGTLILEMVQVSVQLHQLPVFHTTLAASRSLGTTGPILFNVLADGYLFLKILKRPILRNQEGRTLDSPGLERQRSV